MRLLPRSLFGHVMMAVALALLVAQAISVTLLARAAEQRRELAMTHAVAFQLMTGESRGAPRRGGPLSQAEAIADGERAPRLPRRLRYTESTQNPLRQGDAERPARAAALAALLEGQGVDVADLVVVTRPFLSDPDVMEVVSRFPRMHRRMQMLQHELMVVGMRQEGSNVWQIARVPVPPRDRTILRTLLLQTLILFFVLFGLLYLVLRRITRPLAALADRTTRFAGAGAPEDPLPPTGPQDVRRLIEASNAMQSRIGAMLDEKDVMLGAIGHDLKTPLAALRVRIESVEDVEARARMAATIEDITKTLDEILSLARIGRSDTQAEPTELSSLAASVVEEFEDMDQPVTFASEGRLAAPVHLTWLKRGLRNLIGNAVRYGGAAQVRVLRDGEHAVLRVEDEGPGIPEDRLDAMLEPFARGEASRNRATGGAGLGLTIARAVAEQHGGTLVLSNRPEGGLRAEIRLPT